MRACKPEMRRERRCRPDRLWISMGARSNNRAAPASRGRYLMCPAPIQLSMFNYRKQIFGAFMQACDRTHIGSLGNGLSCGFVVNGTHGDACAHGMLSYMDSPTSIIRVFPR